jgi:hypothetical protein
MNDNLLADVPYWKQLQQKRWRAKNDIEYFGEFRSECDKCGMAEFCRFSISPKVGGTLFSGCEPHTELGEPVLRPDTKWTQNEFNRRYKSKRAKRVRVRA